MTPEEAISVIKTEIGQFIIDEKWKNALALAISALEKQDVPDTNVGDMISRADAIRHLKKRLYETALNSNTEHPYYEEIADNRIDVWMNEVPSVQPEIIYCKDCINWDTTWTNDCTPNYHYCPLIDGVRKNNFYCANAERRTDGRD